MSQLIETLYYLLDSTKASEAERRAIAAAQEAVQAAEQRLTPREFERLWDALMDIGRADCQDSFTMGFRLGVQLTLEGLRPVS